MEIINRKAKFEYEFLDQYQCGIVLLGSEVKSINVGKASIAEAFVYVQNNEVFIRNMHIAKNELSTYNNHEEKRERKLLLNKSEIVKIAKEVKNVGITIVPLKIFKVGNNYKLIIALAKGKKLHDKKQAIKERDIKRDTERNG